MKKGIVNIRGKEYKTVALRVSEFREAYPAKDGWAIRTWLISNEGDRVVVSASICDKDDHVLATGFAEEDRTQGNINRTSALENAETSAIGRALAAFGLGGDEYCSADELVNALNQQKQYEAKEEAKVAPPEKPNAITEIQNALASIVDIIGKEEIRGWWISFLKNSDHSGGFLSLAQIEEKLPKTDQWLLCKELQDKVEMIINSQTKREEN